MQNKVAPVPDYIDLDVQGVWGFVSDNGRRFELGKLLTPVPGHEQETHALRIVTPAQDVTFLLNHTDAGWMGIVAYFLNGERVVNERWILRQAK